MNKEISKSLEMIKFNGSLHINPDCFLDIKKFIGL